jgi:hypothetical protein
MSDMLLPNFKCPTGGNMKSYGLRLRQDQRPIAKSSALTVAVREGAFRFKYFLISRLRRGIVAQSSRKVLKL